MQWYYADQGRQIGPVDESALDALVTAGVVRDDTLVWVEGMGTWQAHGTLRGSRPAASMPVLPVEGVRYCGECGRPFSTNELVTIGTASICAACKPVFLQRIREGGQALGTMRYAGFWIRFVAVMIDAALMGVINFLVQLPLTFLLVPRVNVAPGVFNAALVGATALQILVSTALSCAYEVYFISTRGATIGKLALGLKVVRADGSAVSVGLAFGRYFAKWVSGFIVGIGYIMAGFDEQKRALHDRICETRVIYVNR